jgi:tryptophanyl-tRNA synthetase
MQTKESTESIAASQTARRRVFSGIQPSGDLQLGNYLGAMKRWFEEQGEKENFFCVVDLHAMTVHQDPAELRRLTRAVAAMNIAAGLDTSVSTLFIQSHVSTHAEACWLLNCVTPLGWLERMTQYKDKSAKQESVSAGLLDYPVLMAGDILLYDTHEVPVGDDQKQHVELARDIAQRFNHLYGDTFVVPEPMIAKSGARIMGFNDPTVKMSKAYSHIPGHAVKMLDEPDEIKRAIMRAVTDSGREICFSSDPEKAGVNNLLEIYKVITGKNKRQVEADFEDARGYGDLKNRLVEVVVETLTPIRERYNDLMTDLGELDRLLAAGAARAEAASGPKLKQMKEAMGLVLPIPG